MVTIKAKGGFLNARGSTAREMGEKKPALESW